jgi:triacylglycerol lipase
VTDATFTLVPGDPSGVPGRVHEGFTKALEPVAARLDELVAQLKSRRVLLHVTGHSLGGALATLAALRFGRAGEAACPIHTVHTFGSPRVGDAAFVQAFEEQFAGRAYRFVNDEDLVTRVPPRAMNYDHVGGIVYIDEAGRLQRDIGYWYRFLNFAANALGDLQQAVKTTVRDHSMKLYCGHLQKAARSTPPRA